MTREDVINELRKLEYYGRPFDNSKEQGEKAIRKAQALAIAIQILEQEPCEDAISRKFLLDHAVYAEFADGAKGWVIEKGYVEDALPSVQPKPKTGHWITTRTFMHDGEYYCDRCKCDAPYNEKWDYCPNCGAKMEGEK